MSTSLIEVEKTAVQPSIFELPPKQMIAFASQVANELVAVIDKQKLYTVIQGKKHVRIEGWSTLGSFLGVVPREVSVSKDDDGTYEAKVELFSVKTGQIVGQASAICSVDEKRWGNAEDYARRSMAITRATGKAYRLGFSWIMTLAGYEATPFEEMHQPLDKEELRREAKEGYDPQNKTMQTWLIKQLETRKIPADRWDDIGNALSGRASSQLDSVLTTILGAH